MTDQPPLTAPRYVLLLAETTCYHCQATTPTAAIWVGDFQELDEDGEVVDQDSAALLKYVERLDGRAEALLKAHASWVQCVPTQTSGLTYWANHCRACGKVQVDHFVQGVDGPYWPSEDKSWALFKFVLGNGPIGAVAEASRSGWMEQVGGRFLERS